MAKVFSNEKKKQCKPLVHQSSLATLSFGSSCGADVEKYRERTGYPMPSLIIFLDGRIGDRNEGGLLTYIDP